MGEIDPVFTIKQAYSLLYIEKPLLIKQGLYDPNLLLNHITEKSSTNYRTYHEDLPNLQDTIDVAFQEAEKSKSKRMVKYRTYLDNFTEILNSAAKEFEGTIPIFVNGLCITDYNSPKKSGIDPYSNSHIFSTEMLKLMKNYPPEFLDKLRFVYMQAVPFVQKFVCDDVIGLEDILRKEIDETVFKGVGFGDLVKFGNLLPKKGNSIYNPSLFSIDAAKDDIVSQAGFRPNDFEKLVEKKRYDIFLSKNLMAMRYAYFIDKVFPHFYEEMERFSLDGFPLYMEKSSDSANMISMVKYYSEAPPLFDFVGGKQGIIAGTPDKVPTEGICHRTALNRLMGLIDNIHFQWSGNPISNFKIKSQKSKTPQILKSSGKYPFILLENNTNEKHPNAHDLIEYLLEKEDENLTPKSLQYAKDFAFENRVGFSGIEPALVNFFKSERSIFTGQRSMNKTNRLISHEFYGKTIKTPDMLGIFDIKSVVPSGTKVKSDFRGSDFSRVPCAMITPRFMRQFEEGKVDNIGCSIEKMIGSLNRNKIASLYLEALADSDLANSEDVESFWQSYDQDLEPIDALRGTAIHEIFSAPLEGLVHYETLGEIGLDPRSSDMFSETAFYHNFNIDGTEFSASFHPDVYLFLDRGDGSLDSIILDVKTNRVMSYVEHKYSQQTFFYGWFLKHILAEELGLKINNIYTGLIKNSFHRGFKGEDKIEYPHATYRRQCLSPITLHEPDDIMHDVIPFLLKNIVEERRNLEQDSKYFLNYKQKQCEMKSCDHCYANKLICNLFAKEVRRGRNIEGLVLENRSEHKN